MADDKATKIAELWAEYLDLSRWLDGNQNETNEAAFSAVCARHSEIEDSIMLHPDNSPPAVAMKVVVMRAVLLISGGDERLDQCLGGISDVLAPPDLEMPASWEQRAESLSAAP